jgi:lathosterol oxidase
MILPQLYGQGFVVAYAELLLIYYLFGSLIHMVIPIMINVKKIQSEGRQEGAVMRDALYSLGPLAVKAAIWTCVEKLHEQGLSLLYDGPIDSLRHACYLVACVVLLDYLHDAWFYITHRFLHWKPVYKQIHYIHHRSVQPSAFTGYSFHIVEAVIVFLNEILVCWLFPIHMGLHRVYHLFTTIIHEGG